MKLRELRSREAGHVRELKERQEEIDDLNQVTALYMKCSMSLVCCCYCRTTAVGYLAMASRTLMR